MRASFAILALSAALFGVAIADARRAMPIVSDEAIMGDGMPRTLEEFQFFIHPEAQLPTLGVQPYALNTPLYSDGADKLRFIYVPNGRSIEPDGEGLLQFPVGSALIKTFAFGEGDDRRLIETRVLLHRSDGWLALPYRWNDEQTEARLAVAGARVPLTTPDGEDISYRIPNKNQCKTCHSKDGAVVPIGPKARNLSEDWLMQAERAGTLAYVPDVKNRLPVWDEREEAGLPVAARAYLDVNCAHCHQPGGGASNSGLDLRWEQGDPHAIGIGKPPVAAGRGAGGHSVSILPGQPDQSILVHRMASTEPGVAMPELGRSTIDAEGTDIVRRWIAEMR